MRGYSHGIKWRRIITGYSHGSRGYGVIITVVVLHRRQYTASYLTSFILLDIKNNWLLNNTIFLYLLNNVFDAAHKPTTKRKLGLFCTLPNKHPLFFFF